MLEARIASLEDKLRSASVIDASELDNDVVRVGSLVNVKDEASGKSLKYTIVGSTESNPAENKLSNESPVGKALVGQQAQRRGVGAAAQRQGPQAQDHEDRSRLAVSEEQPSELLATRRRKLEALREAGIEPFPHAYPGVRSIAEVKAPYDDAARRRGDRGPRARRRPARRAPRPGQGGVPRPRRPQRPDAAARARRRARRGVARAPALARPRRPDRRRRHASSAPAAASSR